MDFIIDEDGNYIITEDGELIYIEGSEWFGAAEGGMRIVEPITITDAMVGSGAGTVPEGDYAEYSLLTTYNTDERVIVTERWGILGEPIDQSADTPACICSTPTGVIWVADGNGGEIYKKEPGDNTFRLFQTVADKIWSGSCCDPTTGDVYLCAQTSGGNTGDIYKQTGGSGNFSSLSQADREWRGMCATADGVIWASVYGGDLYKLVGGTFTAQSIGNKNWRGICAAPNGDIYAVVYNGDIWVSTDDGASFSAIADTDRYWVDIAAATTGDIFACSMFVTEGNPGEGQVYRRVDGAGLFATTNNSTRYYQRITVDETTDDIYAIADNDLYVSRYSRGHKIYESLIDSNTGHYPPYEVTATTPKWLEISATNKWKVFDGKVNDQMRVVSPAVYTITPGVAFDTVILLNVEADSVTIAVDDPAYSETVVTGATDIVKMDLAGGVASVLTITIANSTGLARCGEIIIGSYYEIGTMKPLPVVSITDYSVKTQDEWGNWTITQRSYSEKMSCMVNVPYASIDAVIAKLKTYRTTPVVWIGNSLYACTIIYGYWKDWSTPVATRGKTIMSLEIEGLT